MSSSSSLSRCPFCDSLIRQTRLQKHIQEHCPKKRPLPDTIIARPTPSQTIPPIPASLTKSVVEPIVDTVPQDLSPHYIVDALNVCCWSRQPTINTLLILLNELVSKERSFLCVFDNTFKPKLLPFTNEEAFKKIFREVYEPALNEFPHLFVEVEKNIIGHMLIQSDRRGSPIVSKDKDLIAKHRAYTWRNKRIGIISGSVEKVSKYTLLNVPALNISARGFAKEPNQLWWSLRERLNPKMKQPEEESRLNQYPLNMKRSNDLEWNESVPIIKVYWRILAAKTTSQLFTEIKRYYKLLQDKRQDTTTYDINRLQEVYNFGSDSIYIGLDEFEGYIVFEFRSRQRAVMECPEVNNAIYIIKGDWKELSKLNRTELIHKYPEKVSRIIHAGNWNEKLKKMLVF